jgi:hypothetical protein
MWLRWARALPRKVKAACRRIELAQRLAGEGFEVRWDTETADVDRLYSADPFGNRLEFIRSGHGLGEIP